MNITIKATNTGIKVISEGQNIVPQKMIDVSQAKPRDHYVYAHKADCGDVFYIGYGKGRRAWSPDRHDLWHRYVKSHLKGSYSVEILADNLSESDAEELESEWICHYGDKLVNWVNMSRKTDFKALEEFHSKRNKNRELMEEARNLEREDIEGAIEIYIKVIKAIPSYCSIAYENGLVGRLLKEEQEELGVNGEINAIDRLSICLIRQNRYKEVIEIVEEYFSKFSRDLSYAKAENILKRVVKAKKKLRSI